MSVWPPRTRQRRLSPLAKFIQDNPHTDFSSLGMMIQAINPEVFSLRAAREDNVSILPVSITLDHLMNLVEGRGFRGEIFDLLYLMGVQRCVGQGQPFHCPIEDYSFLVGSSEKACREMIGWLLDSGFAIDLGNDQIVLSPVLSYAYVPGRFLKQARLFAGR